MNNKERKIHLLEFVNKYKDECKLAYDTSINYKGYKTEPGKNLILLARKHVPYSDNTFAGEIYSSIYHIYKSII